MSEETREMFDELKGPGQTDDELLQELVQQRTRRALEDRLEALETADRDELTALSDA